MTLKLEGTFYYDKFSCNWTFSGLVSDEDGTDDFDFNPDTYGERDEKDSIFYPKENLTRAARFYKITTFYLNYANNVPKRLGGKGIPVPPVTKNFKIDRIGVVA